MAKTKIALFMFIICIIGGSIVCGLTVFESKLRSERCAEHRWSSVHIAESSGIRYNVCSNQRKYYHTDKTSEIINRYFSTKHVTPLLYVYYTFVSF